MLGNIQIHISECIQTHICMRGCEYIIYRQKQGKSRDGYTKATLSHSNQIISHIIIFNQICRLQTWKQYYVVSKINSRVTLLNPLHLNIDILKKTKSKNMCTVKEHIKNTQKQAAAYLSLKRFLPEQRSSYKNEN